LNGCEEKVYGTILSEGMVEKFGNNSIDIHSSVDERGIPAYSKI